MSQPTQTVAPVSSSSSPSSSTSSSSSSSSGGSLGSAATRATQGSASSSNSVSSNSSSSSSSNGNSSYEATDRSESGTNGNASAEQASDHALALLQNYSQTASLSDGQIQDVQKLVEAAEVRPPDAVAPAPKDGLGEARQKFLDTMRGKLDEERMKRVENMAREMERRMAGRGYARILNGHDRAETARMIRNQLQDTYGHLSELAGSPQAAGQYFSPEMRAQLAENFLFHAADPTNVDQGGNGTCWLESGYIAGGFVNHPEAMARFLKEVSLNGSFNATDGRSYKFPPSLFRFGGGDEEGRWTVGNANKDGKRSPVGLIYDEAMSYMVGRRDPDAGSYEGRVGCKRILELVTGDTVHDSSHLLNGSKRDTLMDKGAYIVYQPGHMRTVQMRIDGEFELGETDIVKKGGGPTRGAIIQDNQWGEYNDAIDMVIHDLESNKIVDINNVRNTPFSPNSVTGERPLPGYSPDGSLPDWDRHIGGGDGGGTFVPWGPTPGPGPSPDISPVDLVETITNLVDTDDDPNEVKNLIRTLAASAEGELQAGQPGEHVRKLKEAYEKVKETNLLDPELKARVENILQRAGQVTPKA